MAGFELHPQLAADSMAICDLALCAVRLVNDSSYPWLLLIPRRAGLVDLVDPAPEDRQMLMAEIALACDALKALGHCDKLNVASLGNQVPQLHVHVIARQKTDAAWPNPVWGAVPAAPYAGTEADRLIAALTVSLTGGTGG